MSQLHFYVPDEVERLLRQRAKAAKQPLSRYLAELVKHETARHEGWPEGYFEKVFGGWEGETLQRAAQGDYESRSPLK